jgi:hypothetical protein
MAGFTWDDVQSSRDQTQAETIRNDAPATYKVPGKEWKDPGTFGAFKEGVGRFGRNLSDGIVQLQAAATGDEAVLRGLKGLREPEDAYYKQTQQARPWATGFGEAAPYALVPGGPVATALGVGAMEGLSYGSTGDRAKNAALGGALAFGSGVAGQKVGRMLGGGGGPANMPTREAVAAADRIGAPLSVGQRTGIEGLQRTEDLLSRVPGSSGVMARQAAEGQRAVNRAVGQSLGAVDDGGRLTQDVVAEARRAFGVERNALKAATSLDASSPAVNKAFMDAAAPINKLTQNLGKKTIEEIQSNDAVKDVVMGMVQKQTFTGDQYQGLRTALKNAANTAYKADKSSVGDFYKTLVKGLDDIAQQGQKEAWKASDVKYATLKLLEDTTHVWNPATGDVSAKTFANRFSQVYGAAAKEGRIPGNANDVLLFGKGIKAYPEGSQTGSRAAFNNLSDFLLAPARYGAAKALTSDGIARAAEVPARWLSAGVWPGSPAARALTVGGAQQLTKGGVAGGLLGLEGPYLTTSGLLR